MVAPAPFCFPVLACYTGDWMNSVAVWNSSIPGSITCSPTGMLVVRNEVRFGGLHKRKNTCVPIVAAFAYLQKLGFQNVFSNTLRGSLSYSHLTASLVANDRIDHDVEQPAAVGPGVAGGRYDQ